MLMPYSSDVFDERIKELIKRDYESFLDIGAGAGKFGRMVRSQRGKEARITACEIDSSYVTEFNLKAIYDNVRICDAASLVDTDYGYIADFVFIGDCIEHLRKSDGVDLLHHLVYRAKIVVVIFPLRYIQYDWRGHVSEAHRSVWDSADFQQFDHTYRREKFMNIVEIEGYPAGSRD